MVATEVATLGGGCFWCLEAVFQDMKGINSITSGYSGGFIDLYFPICQWSSRHDGNRFFLIFNRNHLGTE